MTTFHTFDAVLEYYREYPSLDYAKIREVATSIARTKGQVTTDDIRSNFEIDGDKRVIGTALASLARDGTLQHAGYAKTSIKTSHGRPISVFRMGEEE